MPQLTKPYTNWFTGEGLSVDNNNRVGSGSDFGPFLLNPPDTGEFSFDQYVPTTIPNKLKNMFRLNASLSTDIDQGHTPAWYDLTGRISNAAASVNDAFQSTLIKIIIILAIVGVAFIYFQAKVTKIANA